MVNAALQVVGFCLALIGWALSLATTLISTWAKNDIQGDVIESVRRTAGLWTKCQLQSTGHATCDDYDTFFLGLPTSLQGARALVCLSIALGFLGTVLSVFGLDCTTIASDNPRLKARLVMISGVLHFLGGATVGAAVSWFASNILNDYYNKFNQRTDKMVYGEALFAGWGSMVLSVLAALILCCSSWSTDEDDRAHNFTYNPPRSKATAAEYI